MATQSQLDHESSAVQKHIEITQDVITRMAENSRACKIWCVTLVAAVLVLVARTGKATARAHSTSVPAVLFSTCLTHTTCRLGERPFADSYNAFVRNLHEGSLTSANLYLVESSASVPRYFMACLKSFSIWPFYPTLLGLILLISCIVN